ncbi:MAG: SRPBCC family protein [Gemmatimonadetes bacterium]|nr:SRPBCC family protein [Gemmatimonadota bacterium]
MPSTEQSITIHRPPDIVFRYMDDITREREWQPSLRKASQEPTGPTRVGTRKRYVSEFLGRRVENTYLAVEVDPGRRVRYESTRYSSVDATMELTWTPAPEGTHVSLRVEGRPKGVLRFIPKAVLQEAWQSQLRTTLDRLKECLERDSAPR